MDFGYLFSKTNTIITGFDQNKNAVGYAPWEEGQPNGGDDH